MADQSNQPGNTPRTHTITTDKNESKVTIKPVPLGDIIASYLPDIMVDRTVMPRLEVAVTAWVRNQSDHSQEQRTKVLAELKTAMGCLESIYSRVAQTY
jgi:acyl-CoA hydrolase